MRGGFDREKFSLLMKRGKVREEDFRELYPSQSKEALIRTARYYMRAMEGIGLARKNGDGWDVRSDVIRTIEEFERLREKYGYGGDLFEFVTYLFRKTAELLKKKTFLERLSEEYEVEEEVLRHFIEEFLDNLEWKDKRDLEVFLRDFKRGLWMKLGERTYEGLLRENLKRVERLQSEGFTREEALMVVLNTLLKLIPLSLELWEKVAEDSPDSSVETWVEDRLAERDGLKGVELVPVNKKLWDRFQKEVKELSDREREGTKAKLVKRLNQAVEKTLKELKEKKRRKKIRA